MPSEPSILTYLLVPCGKCILLGGSLLQILNETKQPICKESPNTRYNIERTPKNLNLYLAEYAKFFKTNSNHRTYMSYEM